MKTQFDIYDVLIYIVPGAVFSFILANLAINVFNVDFSIPFKSFNTFTGGVALFIISFIAGHILYIIGNYFEKFPPHYKTKFSRKLLEECHERLTVSTKEKIRELALTKFNIVIEQTKNEMDSKKVDEFFKLCQQYIFQKETAPKTELFNRLYSLYRSLFTLSLTGVFYFILLAIKQPLHFSELLILACCIITYLLFKSRWERFDETFAYSVYLNFYILCITEDEQICREASRNKAPEDKNSEIEQQTNKNPQEETSEESKTDG